jgi:valyl-tRNA synthetase
MKKWERLGLGSFNVDSGKPLFVMDTPPPYPSGRPWHIGGASHYAQIDMLARAARMQGFEVLFPIGIDRNGLPVEIYTEKKYGIKMNRTPREKFVELCRDALDDLEEEMIQTLKLMGYLGDYANKYRTDDPSYRVLTQTTFIEQWRSGRVYKGTRPSNYCVDCATTIADAEIEYVELPTKLVYFDFKIGDDTTLTIASTRPELVCTCQAIIVNPQDDRYKQIVGKTAELPLYSREVPVVANPAAKPEFGTGALMVCSYGDYEDVLLFRELGLREVIAIDVEGKMTDVAGPELAGLSIAKAREKVIELLGNSGALKRVETISHRTPVCERSKTPIEIIPLEEYYLKVVDVKEQLRDIAMKLKFHPEMHRSILLNWINVARDWPISRRRFYGTEIPVWYCENCSEPFVPEPGKYYQPWREPPPGDPSCAKCGSKKFKGDVRTFDTWMDSSVSALYVTKYRKDPPTFFAKTYPTNLRPQGKDIVRTWLHYSILRCWQLTGKVPWTDVRVTGLGLDLNRQKMSKSRGNVRDPITVLERYGGECFRLWIASEVTVGSDYVVTEQKIAGSTKFLSKLWNVARFVSSYPSDGRPSYDKLVPTDRWILGELSELASECIRGYEMFDLFIPANKIRDFTWNTFAAHYVEMAKGRAYGQAFSEAEKVSAWFTLHECLKAILLLLAPICPFVTDAIWERMYAKDPSESIHTLRFPKEDDWQRDYASYGKEIIEFNSAIWNEKKAKGLSLKEPISKEIPANLKAFEGDLKAMHNLA